MLAFAAPVVAIRAVNPATTFILTGAVEMGETIPTCNGTPCTQLQANHVTVPTCTTNLNLNPPLTINNVNYRSSAVVTAVPVHTIASPITMPPNPIADTWTHANVPGTTIVDRLTMICQRRERDGQRVDEALDPRKNRRLIDRRQNYTFKFRTEPSGVEFMNHILFHEYQHVADHRWLAQQIIGRWDAMLMDLWQGGNVALQKTVVSTDPTGVVDLAAGFMYSIGAARIFMYWARVAAYSGDLYHDTSAGAAPVLRVASVAGTEVTVVIRALSPILTQPDINNPQPHREMGVKSRDIDGTEIDLAYGPPGAFPPADAQWAQLDGRTYKVY